MINLSKTIPVFFHPLQVTWKTGRNLELLPRPHFYGMRKPYIITVITGGVMHN